MFQKKKKYEIRISYKIKNKDYPIEYINENEVNNIENLIDKKMLIKIIQKAQNIILKIIKKFIMKLILKKIKIIYQIKVI